MVIHRHAIDRDQAQPDTHASTMLSVSTPATGADTQKAVQYLKNVIYLNPKHFDALMYLATLTAEAGDETGAMRYRERAQRIKKRQDITRVGLWVKRLHKQR